jgi:hypothetical protein
MNCDCEEPSVFDATRFCLGCVALREALERGAECCIPYGHLFDDAEQNGVYYLVRRPVTTVGDAALVGAALGLFFGAQLDREDERAARLRAYYEGIEKRLGRPGYARTLLDAAYARKEAA